MKKEERLEIQSEALEKTPKDIEMDLLREKMDRVEIEAAQVKKENHELRVTLKAVMDVIHVMHHGLPQSHSGRGEG